MGVSGVSPKEEHIPGVAAVSWKKNLYVMAITQFVVVLGFNFINPFIPLYMQKLGNLTPDEAALWAGLSSAGSGFAMFLSAPLWGIIADRWGRKLMVLRAMFGLSIFITLMGFAPNIYAFFALRLVQGLFSGNMAASAALVGAGTPRNRMPFAMGLLMIGQYSGSTLGPLFGGVIADRFGYNVSFFATGALMFAAGILTLFTVVEKFDRPAKSEATSFGQVWRLAFTRKLFPVLVASGAVVAGMQMLPPIASVFILELDPNTDVATAAGIGFALMGLLAALSSLLAGRLGARVGLKKMLVISAIGTGVISLLPIWASSANQFVLFLGLSGLFRGGYMISVSSLVGLAVPVSQQGIAYGIAQSAHALGHGFGPLIGGLMAPVTGLRPVFGVVAVLFIAVGLLTIKWVVESPAGKSNPEESPK